jgi:O-antigen ligase
MTAHHIVFWGLCAVMVFLPLPFGGVEEWSIFAFEGMVFVLFAFHLAGDLAAWRSDRFDESVLDLRVPPGLKVLLAVFLGVGVLQLVPLPQSVVKVLSPETFNVYHSLWMEGFAGKGGGSLMTLSFVPGLSLYELLKYVFYVLFGYLVFKHIRSRREVSVFVHVMILCAAAQSFYGLAELFGGTESVLGVKKMSHIGSATGTYLNRNHFAGLLEMVFPVSVGYMLAKASFFSMKRGMTLKDKVLWFSQERLQKCVVYGVAAILIGMGVFFSRSRTGIFAFLVSVFLMIVAMSVAGRRRGRGEGSGDWSQSRRERRFVKVIRTVALVVVFAVVAIGARPIIERFSWESLSGEVRPTVFQNTAEMIGSYPLFGTGLGTYMYAYAMYERESLGGRVVDHAHNDYLELLAESGVAAALSLILFGFGVLGYLFVSWMRRRDYLVRGVVLGCVAGAAAVLIHSFMDFNLHIPANAVYFAALLALGLRVVNSKF